MTKQINVYIVIVFVVFFVDLSIHQEISHSTFIGPSYAKQQITKTVIPPYCLAYTILNEEILNKLLVFDADASEMDIHILINSLACSAKYAHKQLQNATGAIGLIGNTIDVRIAEIVDSISEQEEQLSQHQREIDRALADLKHSQEKIKSAEKMVHESHHSLNRANYAVYNAHAEVKKARVCYIRQHKGLWGFIVRIFTGLAKPACSLVNSAGIKRAKDVRSLAENTLIDSYQRLQAHQQNYATQRTHAMKAQIRLNNTNVQLQRTTAILKEQRVQQNIITLLTEQLKQVELYLNQVFSSSTVLKDEIIKLLDFELLIKPLNATYYEMLKLASIDTFGFSISTETFNQIDINLKILAEKLPKLPLNLMSLDTIAKNCTLSSIPHRCSTYPLTSLRSNVSDDEIQLNSSNMSVQLDIDQNSQTASNKFLVNKDADQNNETHYPLGIFLDKDGTMFIADQFNHSITAWKRKAFAGKIVAGGHGQGNGLHQLNMPTDVLIDRMTNTFIICDAGNKRIMRWPRTDQAISGTVIINNITCFGLVQDKQGNLYVSDSETNAIRRYSTTDYTTGSIIAGGNGKGFDLNQFNFPTLIFIDNQKSIYVFDWNNARIMKWIAGAGQGIIVRRKRVPSVNSYWEKPGKSLFNISRENIPKNEYHGGITSIHINNDNTIFGADCGFHRVMEWKAGTLVGKVVAGGNGKGTGLHQLSCPTSIAVDEDSLFICDKENHRVMLWSTRSDANGEIFIDQISCYGIALDNYGWLYVTNQKEHSVKRFRAGEKNVELVAGGNGPGIGLHQLNTLKHIFVDQYGSVYISDRYIHWSGGQDSRIIKWPIGATEGVVVAGWDRTNTFTDLYQPEGIFVDLLGTIYIADSGNGRVVRWLKGATQGTVIVGGRCRSIDENIIYSPGAITLDQDGNLYVVEDATITEYVNNNFVHRAGGRILQFALSNKDLKEEEKDTLLPRFHFSCSAAHPNISDKSKWAQKGIRVAPIDGNYWKFAGLNGPLGLCVDQNGDTIVVADKYNNRIMQWTLGVVTPCQPQVVAGDNGDGRENNQLSWPTHIVVDQESLIICDRMNHRVMRWPYPNGTNGEVILRNITCGGLALDNHRNLYVADIQNHEVRRYRLGETDGILVAGGNNKGSNLNQLNDPEHIFVDQDHSVYVSDSGNHRVVKWIKDANEGIIVAGGHGRGGNLTQLYAPSGIFIDSLETVYVADFENHRVMRWPKGATQGTVVIDGNADFEADKKFVYPAALSFDRRGDLYITDYYSKKVQRYSRL